MSIYARFIDKTSFYMYNLSIFKHICAKRKVCMYNIERQEKILEILKEKKSCSVSYLANELFFSETTIRRDLNELSKKMKIKKTFGGAVFLEKYSSWVPTKVRAEENYRVKEKIAACASALIEDNMTIFLAESTTVEHLLPYLQNHKGLMIITNSLEIPYRLSATDIEVFSTGGRLLHHSNSYVGEYARKMIKKINADLMFFSVRGLSENGILTTSSTDDDVMEAMMENSRKTCLLIDSSKFGNTYPFTLCSVNEVDVVVTDAQLPNGLNHNNVSIV
ncbi:MAG: DeoR/GlpR transcriptional regulator [Ruminococcaceae bacterium]|nr:DeoR/GlpR transcriptional regulator [Oscillospiraceae bacterium]